MLKKSVPVVISVCSLVVAASCFATLPPKYLEVADFQQCLAVEEVATYSMWCLPAIRPENCPVGSWEKLQALSGSDKLPDCPSGVSVATPAPLGQ